ncbi:MAG: HAD family hydrolase [Acidobacteria bacterium]|nr:HAD family hydrolase [Acidobacteriota bacterium]
MKITDFQQYLQKNQKREVIFDFDETISTLLINWAEWDRAVGQVLHRYDPAFVPLGIIEAVQQNIFMQRFGKKFRDDLLHTTCKYEKELVSGHRVNSVALILIKKARSVANLHIWTSNHLETIYPILQELHLDSAFKRMIARGDVTFIKPHPEGFYLLFDENNPKSAYLLIGDSKKDAEAAKSAGVDFMNISSFCEDIG